MRLRAVGLEPTTYGLKGRCLESTNPFPTISNDDAKVLLGALLGVLGQTHPDLAAVVAGWDQLPEAVRAGIVAMVGATSGQRE